MQGNHEILILHSLALCLFFLSHRVHWLHRANLKVTHPEKWSRSATKSVQTSLASERKQLSKLKAISSILTCYILKILCFRVSTALYKSYSDLTRFYCRSYKTAVQILRDGSTDLIRRQYRSYKTAVQILQDGSTDLIRRQYRSYRSYKTIVQILRDGSTDLIRR